MHILTIPKAFQEAWYGISGAPSGEAEGAEYTLRLSGSSAFGLQSQSRTLVYAPSTSLLGALLLAVHSTRLLEMLWVYMTETGAQRLTNLKGEGYKSG